MPHGEQRGAALQDGSLPENWELQDKRSTVSTSTRERERERENFVLFFFAFILICYQTVGMLSSPCLQRKQRRGW